MGRAKRSADSAGFCVCEVAIMTLIACSLCHHDFARVLALPSCLCSRAVSLHRALRLACLVLALFVSVVCRHLQARSANMTLLACSRCCPSALRSASCVLGARVACFAVFMCFARVLSCVRCCLHVFCVLRACVLTSLACVLVPCDSRLVLLCSLCRFVLSLCKRASFFRGNAGIHDTPSVILLLEMGSCEGSCDSSAHGAQEGCALWTAPDGASNSVPGA